MAINYTRMLYLQNMKKKAEEERKARENAIMVICPRADKCISLCTHKTLHEHSSQCGEISNTMEISDTSKNECPNCVCEENNFILFEEDFEI